MKRLKQISDIVFLYISQVCIILQLAILVKIIIFKVDVETLTDFKLVCHFYLFNWGLSKYWKFFRPIYFPKSQPQSQNYHKNDQLKHKLFTVSESGNSFIC